METMTRADEQMDVAVKNPMKVQPGVARMRELTPAQRRAVMFAQQQVLKAQAAKKAKDERTAARMRMWQEEEAGTKAHAAVKSVAAESETHDVSLREAIGHVLRELRTRDRRTLREVSEKAGVSLGYLSEVERGQKEASSELLSSIADSLGVSTAQMLRMVADYLDSVNE
ncbi:helix-turn-helix protein [Bifidobacterium saguini DSM 23967]|uniref:Helix-turn-helix transcriptional regulator n=3 Tax=Bifidobacterium TaxID=1678 RepID=A0A2N5IVC2_9BIFI|nr:MULTISPECIES: helix-turn-helix transcriptional regulator [Bifidobacterium]KFI93446.1 helix-turn-helix protein [Bifidobacterium saguini DSM 23967]PLS25910.1 XRE family transcriptional regulator [Bifidobacterium imperatoris]QSY57618.1 helix-turn-helix transcriptional regulator [Bifidobacterium imperatoris]QTB90641.1 helix-turn-helix transcriptional regulator [Bifidobacterium saguini]